MSSGALSSVDIQVIDEPLIRSCIEDEREQVVKERRLRGVVGATADTILGEPIELAEVTTLALSFKNIVQIDNMIGLERLTALKLDNNIIKCGAGGRNGQRETHWPLSVPLTPLLARQAHRELRPPREPDVARPKLQ